MRLHIFTLCFLLQGCLTQAPDDSSFSDDSKSPFYYTRLDNITPVDGTENLILRCTEAIAGNYCESICISEDFPQYQRFTLAMSNYESNGKCFTYIFGFSKQDGSIPELKYMVGDYTQQVVSGVTKGFCKNVDVDNPDFEGKWTRSELRDPFNGLLKYYLHWYDQNSNPYRSILMQSTSGDIFTYLDSDWNDSITVQTRNGYQCRKLEELTTSLIENLEI